MLDRFSSQYAVLTALRALQDKNVGQVLFGDGLVHSVSELQKKMPEQYLPDLYLEFPMLGERHLRSFFILHPRDYMLLQYETGGTYFQEKGKGLADLSGAKYGEAVTGFTETGGVAYPFSAKYQKFFPEEFIGPESTEIRKQAGELMDFLETLDGHIVPGKASEDNCTEFFFVPRFLTDPGSFAENTGRKKIHSYLKEHELADDRAAYLNELAAVYELFAEKETEQKRAPEREYLGICIGYYRFTLRKDRAPQVSAAVKITANLYPVAAENWRRCFTFQWHITELCDQRCKHCYLFGQDPAIVCHSAPLPELLQTLNHLTDAANAYGSLPKLVITGGDPILHPEFWNFAELLHHRGVLWNILGNPFHITEETADRLARLGCARYQLSMDGLEEFHDQLRKPGSYQETLRAARVLKKAGIELALMATVSRKNLQEILSAMDVAAERGADIFAFARYCATDRQKAKELYPSPQEYRSFLLSCYEKIKDYQKKNCRTEFVLKEHLFTLLRWELGEFQLPSDAKDAVYEGCHLGQTVCILPDGQLMACRRMDSPVGSVKTETVYDVLEGETCGRYRDVSKIEGCSSCELKNWCRGCRAVGYNATGNLQGKDPMCWYDPISKTFCKNA